MNNTPFTSDRQYYHYYSHYYYYYYYRTNEGSVLSISNRDAIYNGTGNSAHYRLAYADFRSGAWTVAPCGGE